MLEKTLESPLDNKEIKLVNPKRNRSWIFFGRSDTDAEVQYSGHLMWRTASLEKTLIWERLNAGREGDNRGWDGWMASLMEMSLSKLGNWWWTGKPGMLQSMGLQKVGHNWVTELNWTDKNKVLHLKFVKCNWIKTFSIIKPFYGNDNTEDS